MAKVTDVWTLDRVRAHAPDAAALAAAGEVLRKGGLGTVEPTDDGRRGWKCACRGSTDTYQVSVHLLNRRTVYCGCNCPSWKRPCKHGLALLLYLVDHPELRPEAEAPKAADRDFEGLLRAAFRDPDDDTPRLVFADYLEENGQGDRAALIRYQCEQARLKPQAKRYRELRKLIEPLVAKFNEHIGPLPDRVTVEFRRGFLHLGGPSYVMQDLDSILVRLTNLFHDGWVESVRVEPFFSAGDFVRGLGLQPFVAQVGTLDVSANPQSEDAMVALVAETVEARTHGRLARITVHKRNQKALDQLMKAQRGEEVAITALAGRLGQQRRFENLSPQLFDLLRRTGRLNGATELELIGELGDAELAALLTADLRALQRLRFKGWTLTPAGINALGSAPELAHLAVLEFWDCRLEAGAVAALAAASALGQLEELALAHCSLRDEDAEALARSRSFPKLSELSLQWNVFLNARGAEAVLAAQHFPRLMRINLDTSAVSNPAQIPLVLDAPARPKLSVTFSRVNVQRTIEGGEVIVELGGSADHNNNLFDNFAGCAGARRVTQFTAPRMAGRAVARLARGFDPEKLWRLDLTDNPLGNDGAAALATRFTHFKLRELTLSRCRIQSTGVRALVSSPVFATVRSLNLSDNNIGKAGAGALAQADVPAALQELVLTRCGLGAAEKKPLKSKYGARVKV
jgi:uncharacterized protein (TIGR02996 family)